MRLFSLMRGSRLLGLTQCGALVLLIAVAIPPVQVWAVDIIGLFSSPAAKSSPKSDGELPRIKVTGTDKLSTLQSFAVNSKGELIAIVAGKETYGEEKKNHQQSGGELLVLSSAGERIRSWALPFAPQRVAVGANDDVFIGGSGQLARYSAEGTLLTKRESPHVVDAIGDRDRLRKMAEEERQSQLDDFSEQVTQFKEQLAAIEKRLKKSSDDTKPADDNKKPDADSPGLEESIRELNPNANPEQIAAMQRQMLKQQLEMYARARKELEKQTVDDVIAQISGRLQKIHAVTVSGSDVFIATAMTKGYGFAVWRMSSDFADAKQITSGLSGCCGQLDIQAREGELYVAENSKKRVCRFDREGKRLGQFGKADREGTGASFGGCCNPMNLCFTPTGGLLTAESEGRVKRFTPTGEFQGLAGKASVSGGCKNVAVGLSPDGQRLYFFNLDKSEIIVIDPKLSVEQPDAPKNETK